MELPEKRLRNITVQIRRGVFSKHMCFFSINLEEILEINYNFVYLISIDSENKLLTSIRG